MIRPATLDDADAMAALVAELGYPTATSEMRERLKGLLADPSYAAFVAAADDGRSLLGLVGGRVGRYFEKNGLYAQLVILVVATEAHRRGVGSGLVAAVESWAESRGARELTVNSGNHRHDAHRFYEGRGFVATGTRFIKTLGEP